MDTSDGAASAVQVLDRGLLDISLHSLPGMAVGSIEGNGAVLLGANNLSVGGNNENTIFSGVILDGGSGGGTGGSLTKIGSGRLILAGASTFTGGTSIERGELRVGSTSGSATGSGPVQVNRGKLSGTGRIEGAVSIGTGNGSRAVLSPGDKPASLGTLRIRNTVTFNSDGSYLFGLNSNSFNADQIIANGLTINTGAVFSGVDFGNAALPVGTIFAAITNNAATSIAGTFSNLADGSTVTIGSNKFQANYEGGDGNDLTLTVVP